MIDGHFVFDNVIHVYDLSDENTRRDDASQYGRKDMNLHATGARGPGYRPEDAFDWERRWSVEDMYDLVFVQAPTDMAMAQVVPLFEWFNDFFAPVAAQHAMAKAYPDRVLFCGGADPVHSGVEGAAEQIEYQARELGAVSMKFYNGHERHAWRCDDEKLAYPLYEKCRQVGIGTVQFHKGSPFGLQPLGPLSPLDLEAPARDFPDLNFIIHHLALPFFDEALSIAGRFPNVYLALSGNMNMLLVQPRRIQERMGRMLTEVGVHKLLWGSEAALAGGPAPHLRAFVDMEIPEDLRRDYGFPQITRDDKDRILGRNFAQLMGVDIDAKRLELEEVAA
jgi:hypothetical protein